MSVGQWIPCFVLECAIASSSPTVVRTWLGQDRNSLVAWGGGVISWPPVVLMMLFSCKGPVVEKERRSNIPRCGEVTGER